MPNRTEYIDWNNPPPLQDEEFVVEMTYDALNRPVSITQPDGTIVTNGYDKGGLLKTVASTGSATGDSVQNITNITYNPRGQRENIYYGNNTKTRYYYNPLNFRLERLLTTRNNGQDVLQDLNYNYDAVGNIIRQNDNAQQTHYFNNQVIEPVCRYEYDALYRLLSATGREQNNLQIPTHTDFANNLPCPDTATNAMQNYTHRYQYDKLGNMLQMQSVGNWTRDYVYDTATNRLRKHDPQQTLDDYEYDEHGNMLTMPHLSNMSWDYLDQLHSATNGTFTSYYNYNAEGNRTRKVTEKGNITEIRYYVGNYELYQKYVNGSLDFERSTINISDDEKVFVRIETKNNESPIIRYQYDNHLGSACLELDTTGQIISYEEYHPFGTTSYRSGRSETEVSLKRYKYCGKERDEETGLYYYGMRYYAAWLCRFVSVDPLQFKYPYYTPYQYAGNKPITFIDLDGEEEKNNTETLKNSYVIKKGDTFWRIENELNMKHGTLERMNPNINPMKLQIGQNIRIFFNKDDIPQNIKLHSNSSLNGMDNFFKLTEEGTYRIVEFSDEDFENMINTKAIEYDSYLNTMRMGGAKAIINANSTGGLLDMKKYFLNNIQQYSSDNKSWVLEQTGVSEPATRTLFVFDGYAYNLNEFGNLLFGAVHGRRGTSLKVLITFGHVYSVSKNKHFDDKNEVTAVKRGYHYGKKQH